MTRTVSLKELRPKLPVVMDAVDKRMERYVVTKRGQPTAVIISIDDYEGMLETMEIMRDKALMKRIRKAEREYKAGKTYSHEAIVKRLGLI